ncbi:hypothetical protein OQA88_5900 [Cercophora sp. LCS_1]
MTSKMEDLESRSAPDDTSLSDSEIDRLGRQRPEAFSSTFSEILFGSSLLLSMLMAEFFISGFNIVLPDVAKALSIPHGYQTWPASVFALVTGAFLLPFGRLADIYGAYIVFLTGLFWFTAWCLISGFSTNYTMLIIARALAGLGPAAFLPTGIALIAKTYRPGPRKNLVFSLYCAFAPIGFFIGIIIGGATTQLISWRWYFYIGAMVLFVTCLTSLATIPNDYRQSREENKHVRMDWWGVATIVPGLALLTFSITDGAHAPDGFKTGYIIATLVLGVVFLAAAVYVQGWVAEQPLLPFDLFEPRYMGRMSVALFFAYGVFGIFLFYASLHIADFMGASALKTAVWFTPMAAGGMVLATIGGFTLHLLPGRVLFVLSGLGSIASVLLFALIPDNANYWAFVFPAMIGSTVGVDITYLVSNVFITNNVPRHRQGLAGALINTLLFLGISFFLGLADLAVSEHEKRNPGGEPHRVAFWFATACAAVSLVIYVTIDIGKAESDLTVEEKAKRNTEA